MVSEAVLTSVLDVLEEVLGARHSGDSDLTSLGIDSLAAQQIAARLEEDHSVVIDLGDAVACATPRALAELVITSPPSDLPILPTRSK